MRHPNKFKVWHISLTEFGVNCKGLMPWWEPNPVNVCKWQTFCFNVKTLGINETDFVCCINSLIPDYTRSCL